VLTEAALNKLAKDTGRVIFSNSLLKSVALLLLLTAAPLREAFRVAAFSNGDIWWHLRMGLWILQSHAIPRNGLFSQNLDSPWIDSSWGFELLLAAIYKLLGLRSISALLMFFKFALAAVTFLLAGGWRRNFWGAILLSAVAQYILFGLQPLPIFFSILFLGIALILLLQCRRQDDARYLYWLPLLFLLWANLDIQFVNGLLLLGLYLAAELTERLLYRFNCSFLSARGTSLGKSAAVAGLSLVATLITPYSFHLIPEIMETGYSHTQFKFFAEMAALRFREPQDFVLLLLVMATFLVLGLQRSRDFFKCALMIVTVMLAFRVQRDVWCVVLPAIAIIAGALPEGLSENELSKNSMAWRFEKPLALALSLVVILLAMIHIPSDELLLKRASRSLPIKACNFIRDNQLPGPLFNSYAWGGFLIWYLPEYPVSIDGRLNLYGNEANEQYFKLIDGTIRFEQNPSFARARTLLLQQDVGLAKALTTLPPLRQQFRVAYQDDMAVVLERQ
jgi:hypothetical protein